MKKLVRTASWLAAVALVALPARAIAQQNAAQEWNDVARQLIVIGAYSPVQQTRLMAIAHVAMHDAVNSITRKFEIYGSPQAAADGLSADAAAIGAAHRALLSTVGDSTLLSTRFGQSLAARGLTAQDASVRYGESIADAIVAARQQDGASTAAFAYVPPGAGELGVWTPLPGQTSLLPGWGSVMPFVLRHAAQFRPDAPPALDSERYARDYNEIVAIGAQASATRTAEQGQIAQFWRASPTALWNPILRRALTVRGDDLSSTARVMALFYLAAADASIACWESKYVYNFWRPQAAIARGADDGNDATVGDPAWRPYIDTPPHPDYVSGHTANSGAMAFVLREIFGDAPGYVIEARSTTATLVRNWQTFSEGVDEVIDARVYSGIHFRTADEVGARLGRQVAKFVLTHALKPGKGHD